MNITSYEQALQWIHSLLKFGIKPGLKRMEWMLSKLGNPERQIKAIHIGGTNGKGSTVTFLKNILVKSGYQVGTFTSPFIEVFNERISINGKPIPNDELIKLSDEMYDLVDELSKSKLGSPTEFEVITVMSFLYFQRQNIDIALYEVGLGGRFDSTNVVQPIVTCITNIGYDHTHILGDTIEEIATEKAGIIKKGAPIVTTVQKVNALKIIHEQATSVNTSMFRLDKEFFIRNITLTEGHYYFDLETPFSKFLDLQLQMKGKHQVYNSALAVVVAEILSKEFKFAITEAAIRAGLKKALWPGRFEEILPEVVIDGAHNIEGVEALVESIQHYYPNKKIHVIFSALKDKPIRPMLEILEPHIDTITFTSFDFPRAASAEEIGYYSHLENPRIVPNYKMAVKQMIEEKQADEIIIITGSLYFISAVREFVKF